MTDQVQINHVLEVIGIVRDRWRRQDPKVPEMLNHLRVETNKQVARTRGIGPTSVDAACRRDCGIKGMGAFDDLLWNYLENGATKMENSLIRHSQTLRSHNHRSLVDKISRFFREGAKQ